MASRNSSAHQISHLDSELKLYNDYKNNTDCVIPKGLSLYRHCLSQEVLVWLFLGAQIRTLRIRDEKQLAHGFASGGQRSQCRRWTWGARLHHCLPTPLPCVSERRGLRPVSHRGPTKSWALSRGLSHIKSQWLFSYYYLFFLKGNQRPEWLSHFSRTTAEAEFLSRLVCVQCPSSLHCFMLFSPLCGHQTRDRNCSEYRKMLLSYSPLFHTFHKATAAKGLCFF